MKKIVFIAFLISLSSFLFSQNTLPTNGDVGVGTTDPRATLHVKSEVKDLSSTSSLNSNLIIEGTSNTRETSKGTALGFAIPANTDGSNPWEQGRIFVTPDNPSTTNAAGRMHLQTRYYLDGAWRWRSNLVLRSSGNIGIGTTSPASKLFIVGDLGFHQPNSSTNGIIWKNGSYEKISAAIKPVDMSSYARQGIGFFTGNFGDRTTDAVERMRITQRGYIGIGTDNPKALLSVNGTIISQEIKVLTDISTYPDFVFADDYKLMPIPQLEKYIKANKHLPEIPKADEVTEGVALGEMNVKLLQKIEELTLYMIDQNKESKAIRAELKKLKEENEELKKKLEEVSVGQSK